MLTKNKFDSLLFESALNGLTAQTAILKRDGEIVAVNRSWVEFGQSNEGRSGDGWLGTNYRDLCLKTSRSSVATPDERDDARAVARALAEFQEGHADVFEYEYPCHAPDQKRWFLVKITPFEHDGESFLTVSHIDITKSYREREQLKGQYKETLEDARHDDLTGLLTREPFMEQLGKAMQSGGGSLIIFDLDNFKAINDQAGHTAGDDILSQAASHLKQATRESDAAGRYGGDELALLLTGIDPQDAEDVADRCRREFEKAAVESLSGTDLTATINAGVAAYSPDDETERDWVERADEALSRAKKAKNTVASDNDL